MIITDKKKLSDIQREFGDLFPFLKIEFYSGTHHTGGGSPVETRLDTELEIGKVRKVHNEGDFRINADMKVCDFEQGFSDKYGLNVQVMRRSGNIWMQTTATDNWTLAEQNRKGSSSASHYNEKYNQ